MNTLLPEVGMDRSMIEQYEAGAGVPSGAIRGLSGEELDAQPVPGTWSIREIVVHLMDSDLVGSERMKRVIAMEEPSLLGYDETAFARALDYGSTDVGLASEVFALNRKLTARILRGLPDRAFDRVGHHSERGPETLRDLVEGYVGHLEHHMTFVRRKRELLGKPLVESL
jgi:DinB superfamily